MSDEGRLDPFEWVKRRADEAAARLKASHRSVKRSLVGHGGHMSDNLLFDGF
jgi:hypothetical protein